MAMTVFSIRAPRMQTQWCGLF
uniref:Uncharacterized protein n=1 Tax=Arundo donax TaxID=35708 RepID=A0A0A9C384_ARUDO